MSRPEEHIDRVLAGLRDAQPASGLEQRILRAVQARSRHEQQRSRAHWLFPAKQAVPAGVVRVPLWTTGVAVLALVAVVLVIRLHHATPRPTVQESVTGVLSPQSIAHGTHPGTRPVQALTKTSQMKNTELPHRAQVMSTHQTKDAEQSLAMEEMEAPSLLAPPLPMTTQERAVSRLGQRPRSDAVAVLDAEHRARDQAQATTEFYNFFEPAKDSKSNN